ncbi:MAG: ABC transporter permease [Anaerolineae bacterium]|nr:ABC transporter permease [Anaerolineae bacterium]
MSSFSSSSSSGARGRSALNSNILLVLLAGVLSLLFAQQVATGWLALGERLNISRRDFNLLELVTIASGALWGVFALWTALGMLTQRAEVTVRDYFDEGGPMPAGVRFAAVNFALISLICLLIAIQVFTGWLPLGDRVNIPRSNLNFVEWITIIIGLFWTVYCLRTAVGIWRRERPAWSWGQWALLLMTMGGMVLVVSGLFDIQRMLSSSRASSILDNFSGFLLLMMPGVLLTLASLAAYRDITHDYGDVRTQKAITGTLAERARARDIASKRVPAGQAIRNRLAASPGAGAIIGFVGLFMAFSVATDLFLEPQSLAGALTNNITRGIVAIGATMLMISGEFDLSVGSLLGIGGMTFMGLITGQFPPGIQPMHPVLAAVTSVAFVCALGYLNGFILIRTGIPSFIVTLSTLLMYRGLPLVFIVGGRTLRYVDYSNEPPLVDISRILLIALAVLGALALAFVGRALISARWADFRARWANLTQDDGDFRYLAAGWSGLFIFLTVVMVAALAYLLVGSVIEQISLISQGSPFLEISFFDVLNGRITSLPFIGEIPRDVNFRVGVVWWLVLVLIFQFVLTQTRYGNATFAVGGNAGAARAQGINVNRVKITNYVLVALLVGFASLLDASRLQSIDALRGQGLELEVIAATVIGGALLTGGYGSIIGALLGVFIFGMMQTGLVLIGIDARLFDAVIGGIILIAVIINNWSRRIR